MKTLPSIALIGLLAFAGGCVDRANQAQAKRTEALVSDLTKPVTVLPVRSQELLETQEITGQLTTSKDVRVGAKMPGKLVAVYVRDGDSVSQGQALALQDTANLSIQMQQAQAQVSAMRASLSQATTNAKLAPERTAAAVKGAEAQVRSAKAIREKARNGARPEERAQADAQLKAAESNLETAKLEAARQKDLYEQGASSKQQLERAQNALSAAQSQYENLRQQVEMLKSWSRAEDIAAAEEAVQQAESNLASVKAAKELDALLLEQVRAATAQLQSAEAQLKLVKQQIEDATIRSPITGRISGIPAQPGQYVGGGEPVARVVGLGNDYFEGEVPETAISMIKTGNAVEVTLEALPGRKFDAKVSAISPEASDVGRLFRIRVDFSSSDPERRPGMFATGVVIIRRISNAKVVPAAAVQSRSGKDVVFVIKNDAAELRPVETGIKSDGLIQVDGVNVGDLIAVTGQTDLVDGSKVKVQEQAAQSPATKTEG